MRPSPLRLVLRCSLAVALAVPLPLAAQERIDSAMNAAIRAEGFGHSRVFETARLLSDGFGPRLAGSPGFHAAARWARERLLSFGATTAVLEPWGTRGPGWELRRFSVEVTSPAYLRVTAMPKAWSLPLARPVTGVPLVIDVTGPADFDRWRGKLRGRIVLLGRMPDAADTLARFTPGARRFTDAQLDSMTRLTDPGEPRDYWADADGFLDAIAARDRIRRFLREQGVVATLEPSDNELTIRDAEYDTYRSSRRNNLPAFVVDRSHYRRILAQLDRGARVSMTVSLDARTIASDTTGYNVIAEIPGTDPALRDEVVMVGGHFDSWHTGSGATDNAAGSAVAMEVLRILTATGARPRRTIRVALWDGEEEEDYWGSMGYVKKHFGDPVTMRLKPEHERLAGYFNVDNGTGRVRGLYLQGHEAVRPIFAQLLEPFRDLGATTLTIAKHGSTDHMTFNAVGLPGFEVIQDPIDYEPRTHHTGLDASGFLLERDLQQASVVVASLVYHVAMRDEKLPRPVMPPPKAPRVP